MRRMRGNMRSRSNETTLFPGFLASLRHVFVCGASVISCSTRASHPPQRCPPKARPPRCRPRRPLPRMALRSCHQATGAGLPGVFPPLAGSEWANADASQVAKILLLGIDGPITIKGATFHGVMPAFGHQLSDAEIAAVASYVRSSFGNMSPAVTADVVKAERAKLGNRSTPWAGAAELLAQH